MRRQTNLHKHLEVANYPPPYDGWSTHTRFVVEEIRRRGHTCHVLKINENRHIKSSEYVDVQNGLDYFVKVIRFAARGYSINVHVNAESRKGYVIALIAVVVGRLFFRKATLTFHGGVPQSFFPAPRSSPWHWKFRFLFNLCSGVLCDSAEIKLLIKGYGVRPGRIGTAAGFSAHNLRHQKVGLSVSAIARPGHLLLRFLSPGVPPGRAARGDDAIQKELPAGRFHLARFPAKRAAGGPGLRFRFFPG